MFCSIPSTQHGTPPQRKRRDPRFAVYRQTRDTRLSHRGLRSDVTPVEIIHPAVFPAQPRAGSVAAARAGEADKAANKADQARLAAVTASREAARAMMRVAENLKLRAEAQLAAADRTVASAGSAEEAKAQAEDAKAKAAARAAEFET